MKYLQDLLRKKNLKKQFDEKRDQRSVSQQEVAESTLVDDFARNISAKT
jgi:hypothetical protein